MTDKAPDRIWATGNGRSGSWNAETVSNSRINLPETEYVRADLHVKVKPLALAKMFHETYEALAPEYGYNTRKDTRNFDPQSPNGKLMVAVSEHILSTLEPAPMTPAQAAWQPIETAPTHELAHVPVAERILLFVPPYGVSTGHWNGERWSCHSVLNAEAQPTHWMPLPALRAIAEGESQ